MKKLALVLGLWLVLLLAGGVAAADGSGSPDPGGSGAAAFRPQTPPSETTEPSPRALDDHAACVAAMNKDPEFAKSIILTADKQIDQQTIAAHEDALHHIQKNERHVIYAYAALWVIAALLLAYLFMRQQALKAEIATLRTDLRRSESDA
ncbi:hypothetical protein BH11MYX1_BH11MYX1_02030 [soil metagenome]